MCSLVPSLTQKLTFVAMNLEARVLYASIWRRQDYDSAFKESAPN